MCEPHLSGDVRRLLGKDDALAVHRGSGGIAVVVTYEPLKNTVLRDGKEQVALNGRGLLHFRVKEELPRQPTEEEVEGVEEARRGCWKVNQRA
jgi:mannosyl-oligosaccharide alpha-1,3-glucosidase